MSRLSCSSDHPHESARLDTTVQPEVATPALILFFPRYARLQQPIGPLADGWLPRVIKTPDISLENLRCCNNRGTHKIDLHCTVQIRLAYVWSLHWAISTAPGVSQQTSCRERQSCVWRATGRSCNKKPSASILPFPPSPLCLPGEFEVAIVSQ